MNRCLNIFLMVLLLTAGVFAAGAPGSEVETAAEGKEDSSAVTKFREKFSLRFLCDYNFIAIWNSAYGSGGLKSNRPINIGAGFGYDDLFTLFGTSWDVSWDLTFALPFITSGETSKTQAFETGLDFFPGNWWLSANICFYSGFSTGNFDDGEEDEFVDLSIVDMYFSMLWMATANERFAPRSAYFLDRRQKQSAGSLIIGGRLQRNIAEDPDDLMAYYDQRRDLTTVWVDMGYTYTFVFGNGFFGNLWGVVGVAWGRENASDGYALLPETDLKTAWGYIGEKWSWNVVLKGGYSVVAYRSHWEQKFVSSFEILVVRRF